MLLNNQILPTREQFIGMMKNYPADTPVVMINILRFRDQVDGREETGTEAYDRYITNVTPLLQAVGGKVIWRGEVKLTVIGDDQDQPDVVLLVEYPSVQKFAEMSTSEAYRAISHDREIALTYGGLLASTTL